MNKDTVFVDTNIILDWLGERAPFFKFAKALFLKAEKGEIEILISTMSYISAEYILRKQLGKEKTLQALNKIRSISTVCMSGGKEIDLALVSDMKDFEDSFQYYTALNNSARVIITRNLKDFVNVQIPIMSAEDYIKSTQKE
ncbi:MAG: type II toxin-antitoxin system VapC family toxin [Saprospiraceae bacterium]|jgi:predicted nucleic acid-binding protein